ncbi:MAG: outer membrane lipoprotein carrier protein LolA [Gammaproteobacteria bacterium]|nr:MAG: outer membrane lipoprotein carrier protein LolA [Gammaproteobacteria bacterium]
MKINTAVVLAVALTAGAGMAVVPAMAQNSATEAEADAVRASKPLSAEASSDTSKETSSQPGAGIARLERFLDNNDSFSARFEQTLYDADNAPLQTSRGTMRLKRPGRFIWDYETEAGTPTSGQRLVADGERVWMLDDELEQVTVNPIAQSMSGSPFALLMGTASLDEAFDAETLGVVDGIEWVSLTPLSETSDFEQVYIGLNNAGLAAMELRDNFGQATQIRFTDFDAGVSFEDELFEFKVPTGYDVIGLDEMRGQ